MQSARPPPRSLTGNHAGSEPHPMNTQRTARFLLTALTCAAIAGAATAQTPVQTPAQTPAPVDTDLLRGPAVTDTHVPGASDAFAGRPMAGADTRPDERPLTMPEFVRNVHGLDAPGVDPALNLNDGQRAVIEVMLREHREIAEAWRDEHKDELKAFRGDRQAGDQRRDRDEHQGRQGRRGASEPARADSPERDGQPVDRRLDRAEHAERLDGRAPQRGKPDENTKAQLQSLLSTRPGAEAQQAQIWDVLTPEQRAFVETSIERRRAEAIAHREMIKQQREEKKDARDARQARKGDRQADRKADRKEGKGRAMRELPEGVTPEQFREQALERIGQLPPEQQEQALQRLNRALERMEKKQRKSDKNAI